MNEMLSSPQDINALAAQFEQAAADPKVEIVTEAPPSDEVYLPAGYLTSENVLVKTAQIRELNGADEEALAKAGSLNRAINTALTRGLVAIGDEKVTKQHLDTLLAGDRDAILLGIRIATFGETAKYTVFCRGCNSTQEVDVDLVKDIETKELEDPIKDRIFEVPLKKGEAVVALPNGITNNKITEAGDPTVAEVITILLSGCVVSVNGMPSMGKSTALNLSMADREAIVSAIYDRNPGPRLGEVNKACGACGEDLTLSLSLQDLFRL